MGIQYLVESSKLGHAFEKEKLNKGAIKFEREGK